MKNVLKTGLFALLLAFASCQNNSPAPQAAKQDSTATKPAEPTVLPNVKCYEGVIVAKNDCMNSIVVQVKTDSIGVSARVGCLGAFDNVLALDMPTLSAFGECKVGTTLYFTVSEFQVLPKHLSYPLPVELNFKIMKICLQPILGFGCPPSPHGIYDSPYGLPTKYAKISSYSFKNCESKK